MSRLDDSQGGSKEYWCKAPTERIAGLVRGKVKDWKTDVQSSGRLSLWSSLHLNYYRATENGAGLAASGTQGELTTLYVNQFRNLISHMLSLVTTERPAFDAMARNTDAKSQAQAIIANGLLHGHFEYGGASQKIGEVVETAIVLGEAYLSVEWDAKAGELYDRLEDGTELYNGDVVIEPLHPVDVIRDVTRNDGSSAWTIVRRRVNRYDLAARYPDMADAILSSPDETTPDVLPWAMFDARRRTKLGTVDSDDIDLLTLYVERSPAMPEGRIVKVVGNHTLSSGPLPYKQVPIHRFVPARQSRSSWGYTIAMDLLAPQEMLDICYSSIASNQRAFGVQNIAAPRGTSVSVDAVAGGINLLEFDPAAGPPIPLQLCKTAPEIFGFIDKLESVMETLAGMNSVQRGEPQASLKSGAALALMQSLAIQFMSVAQSRYVGFLEGVGTSLVQIYQMFAKSPRIVEMAGKSKAYIMREFQGSSISDISRVQVQLGSAVSRTLSGKMHLAEMFLQNGIISTPSQIFQLIETGTLDAMTESDTKEFLLVAQENEALMAGDRPVLAVVTDDHVLHIKEHRTVLGSLEARGDAEMIQRVAKHLQEHMTILRTTDPQLLQVMGQPPMQAPAGPQGPGGGAPAPMDAGGGEAMPQEAQLPNMPTNPMTGEVAPGPAPSETLPQPIN